MMYSQATLNTVKDGLVRLKSWLVKYAWAIPLLVVLLMYWRLPLTYFEQDEWQAFEHYVSSADQSIATCVTVQRPLTCVVNTIQWRLFGAEATFYALFSLALVLIITFAFYQFLRHWELPPYKRVLAAALFPLFAAGSQAITWLGAFSASLPSFLFALLAVDLLLVDIKKPSWKYRLLALGSALISLYFKEESLWLFPVLFVAWWLYSWTQGMKLTIPHFFRHLGLILAAILVFLFFERLRQVTGSTFTGLVSTTDSDQYAMDVVKALFLLPAGHLSHIVVAPEYLISLGQLLGKTVAQLSYLITAGLLLLTAGLLVIRKAPERPLIIFLAIWALSAFVSYAIFGKNPEFLEGRYYFAAQAPVVTLLVLGLLPNRMPKLQMPYVVGISLFILILLSNLIASHERLDRSVKAGQERRHIISFIKKATGPLPEKAVIYTETSNYGYAGQAAFLLPFQNGLTTTFRVLYQNHDQDYRKLAEVQGYLWDLLAQGYDEVDGVGFGYFRDYDKLLETIKEKKLPVESVYAFRYADEEMADLTRIMRDRLAVELSELTPVDRVGWKIRSSNDQGVDERHGIDKALDADPKSDWATPHTDGQFIEVDLGRPVADVAKVTLVTADGNSFPRILRFDYSPDGKNWHTDFTDVGKLVNNDQTPIIFKPKTIQKFRVTIVDKRPIIFAWSLADIRVEAIKK